jgi:hypothetical protein
MKWRLVMFAALGLALAVYTITYVGLRAGTGQSSQGG